MLRPNPDPPRYSRLLHRDLGLAAGTRRILHLDVDAFLASVEEAVHPELRGLPVVIGGEPTGRNLVMSCSYPARAYGVRPGMSLAEAARRCPHAVFRHGDSQAANRLRSEVARVLVRFSPTVEIASIDDFFLDLSGTTRLLGAAFDTAQAIRAAIAEELALPVTIGVGTNRLMARLAGKLAKPGAVAEILPGGEAAFLARLPIEHLPGVGHVIGRMLERFSIRTAGELLRVSREVLFASFGRAGLVLFDRARGIDREPVEPTFTLDQNGNASVRAPRSIRRDSTFEPEEERRELVEAMLSYLVERAAYRLRAHGLAVGTLEVRTIYVDTRTPAQRDAHPERRPLFEARRSFEVPTDSTDELWRAARALYRSLPRRRALTKRVGLTLANLAPSAGWQGRLFDERALEPGRFPGPFPSQGELLGDEIGHGPSYADRQRSLDRALDELRAKHGFGRLLRGSSLPLKATHTLGPDGFPLRTPSLNQ